MERYLLNSITSQVFSTHSLPEKERFDYWMDLVCRTLLKLDCEYREPQPFFGELRHSRFAGIELVEMRAHPHAFLRTREHLSKLDQDAMVMSIPLTATSDKSVNSRYLPSVKGDISFYDGSTEQKLYVQSDIHAIVIQVPKVLFDGHLSEVSSFDATVVPTATPLGRLVSDFFLQVIHAMPQYGIDEKIAARDMFLSMLSISLTTKNENTLELSDIKKGVLAQVKSYIREHCHMQNLVPAQVAIRFHMSVRYLYKLFEDEPYSLAQYTQRCRLERSITLLINRPTMQLAQVAYRSGFADPSHYSRAFKRAFLISPKEYRGVHLGSGGSETYLDSPARERARLSNAQAGIGIVRKFT